MGKKKWTFEMLQKEALKYESRSEFQKRNNKAYQTAYKRGIINLICSHMKPKYNTWTFEKIHAEALKYESRSEFQKFSPAYKAAVKRGILDQVCSHMKPKHKTWTKELIHQEALKYESRDEFRTNSKTAYNAATRLNILDQVCSHMTGNKTWTFEKIHAEALKYETRGEFERGSSAYSAAKRLGILDQVCSHMKPSINVSLPERRLFNKIKETFPKVQKLRIKNINIIDKPYIKGFDIDIYIPSLKKGVEFDGTYYHSVPGLKRGRPNWPDKDLGNYHSIKDNYFLNKNISILHVNEVDWNKDPEKEIEKCLEFLQKEKK